MPVKKTKKEVKKPAQSKTVKKCCSFCGKNAETIGLLIAGPNDIFICDECVTVCLKILNNEAGGKFSLCPVINLKASQLLETLGSELSLPSNQRTRVKYDILYLASKNPLSEKIFSSYVLPLAEKHKVKVKHLKDILDSKTSFDKELLDIYNASLIIADVHGQDPDIMFFLGMINIIGKPLVMLIQNQADILKGLQNNRYIFYKNSEKSLSDISAQIQPAFQAIKKIKKLTKSLGKK